MLSETYAILLNPFNNIIFTENSFRSSIKNLFDYICWGWQDNNFKFLMWNNTFFSIKKLNLISQISSIRFYDFSIYRS